MDQCRLRVNTVDFEERPDGVCNVSVYWQADFRSLRSSGIWFEILERQESACCVKFTTGYSWDHPEIWKPWCGDCPKAPFSKKKGAQCSNQNERLRPSIMVRSILTCSERWKPDLRRKDGSARRG